jgi:hypothetical protein
MDGSSEGGSLPRQARRSSERVNNATVHYRKQQWIYLGPILAAPLSHVAVTLYRSAKTPRQKQMIVSYGIIGTSVMTVGARLWLMFDAGYPGGNISELVVKDRVGLAQESDMKDIANPPLWKVIRDALRGFG